MKKILLCSIIFVFVVSISVTSIFAQSQYEIPDWIKNNVKWWTEGAIDDNAFVSGIEFLISEGVIDVPITQKTVNTTNEIPSWVRTNAEWWADGVITDSDFVKGIEYLANSGIIQVKQTTQSPIDPPSLEIDARSSDDTVKIIQERWMCSGNARCFTGTVTQVIDGDTIKVGGQSIRFAMTSAPELNEPGGIETREFIETICSVGSIATVDEDDGQNQRLGYMRFYKEGQPVPYNEVKTTTTPKQIILHASENQLDRIVDMLRNEKPCSVYYSSSNHAKIYTGREPVGEEETQ